MDNQNYQNKENKHLSVQKSYSEQDQARQRQRQRQSLSRSFANAFSGIGAVIRSERNIKIQLVLGVLAVCAGFALPFTVFEWCFLIILIFAVLAVELLNSALEKVVDLVTQHYDERARYAKDVAAGAVLLFSIAALLCGVLLYTQALLRLF